MSPGLRIELVHVLIFDSEFYEESRMQKIWRKIKEEPLIPFGPRPSADHESLLIVTGTALTAWAFLRAARSVRKGDHNAAQRMFRARILGQAFTLVCMVAGSIYYAEDRKRRKVFDDSVSQRKAQEKNEAWIRELEARDREEKEEQLQRRKAQGKKVSRRPQGSAQEDQAGVILPEALENLRR